MQVRRALAWTVLGQGCLFVIQFAGQVLLTRLLTPYEIGVYAAGLSTLGVLSAVQAFGLNSFVVREHAMEGDLLHTVFTVNALISIGLALATFLASFLLGSFLHDHGVLRVLRVLALIPLLAILDFRPNALMQRHMQFKGLALTSAARALATTGATLVLALSGFSYMSMAWGALIGAATGTALLNLSGRRHVGFGLCVAEWRRVTRFGLHMLAISGTNQISDRASDVILGRLLGLAALGYYSRASSIITILWQNIYMVFARVALSDLSDKKRVGSGSIRESYLGIVANMTGLLWPLFAGLAVLAGPLVHFIYGPRWMGSALPLSLLSIATMVMVTITMAWEVFVISGETGAQARFEFIRATANVVMFSIGSLFNMVAAASTRIAAAVFSQVLYAPHLMRMTDTVRSDYGPIYARSLLVTAAAIAPAVALMTVFGWSSDVPILEVAGSVVAGIGCWGVAAFVVKHALSSEMSMVAGKIRNAVVGRMELRRSV